jgi:glutathione peroxidase-family protein
METSETHQISHEELRKYAGQYVAVINGKVVASGKNLYKKIEELEKKHPDKKILVTYIPTEDLLIL